MLNISSVFCIQLNKGQRRFANHFILFHLMFYTASHLFLKSGLGLKKDFMSQKPSILTGLCRLYLSTVVNLFPFCFIELFICYCTAGLVSLWSILYVLYGEIKLTWTVFSRYVVAIRSNNLLNRGHLCANKCSRERIINTPLPGSPQSLLEIKQWHRDQGAIERSLGQSLGKDQAGFGYKKNIFEAPLNFIVKMERTCPEESFHQNFVTWCRGI